MQHPRSIIRPQWPSRTAGDARAAPLEDDLAIASQVVQIDQTFGVCLYPSQLLTFEMLRRPIEFTQYASDKHRKLLKDYQMTQSMSRKGNCWNNAPMESFFKTLKVERAHQTQYETRAQARLDIVDWIEGFYNRQRLRSSIGYQTPVNAEQSPVAA